MFINLYLAGFFLEILPPPQKKNHVPGAAARHRIEIEEHLFESLVKF
jgi:hypothetical protein